MSQYEQPGFEQFKDSRTLPVDNRLYTLRQRMPLPPNVEWTRCLIEEMKDQARLGLESLIRKNLIPGKSPAYMEPPYYTLDRKVLIAEFNVVKAFVPIITEVFRIPIPDRHGLVITSIGLDSESPTQIANRLFLNWFEFRGDEIAVLDDNTVSAATPQGRFTMPFGTFAQPLDLVKTGARIPLKAVGATNLVMFASPSSLAPVGTVKMRVIMTYYLYSYDHATESEVGELIR